MEEPTAPDAEDRSSSTPPVEERTEANGFPRLRLEWQESPMHGPESTKFSVEVHHGGNFVGFGQSVNYLDEKNTVWFDNLERNTFNLETLCCIIDQLGYEQKKYVFWCPPGKSLDELMEIADDRAKSTSSRGRKRKQSSKMKEHVEQLMEAARRKKSKQVVDENGDVDFLVIRTHIHQNQVRLDLDPEHQDDSMVHILGHEGAATGIPLIMEEMPEENCFIAANRANVPAARGPLVTTAGRALGATRSKGSRGATGARARGPRGARGTSATGRKRSKKDAHQEEFQSTQGAPTDDA